jgi:hypothetical protein
MTQSPARKTIRCESQQKTKRRGRRIKAPDASVIHSAAKRPLAALIYGVGYRPELAS